MKICAIICEYNPFHNGHQYLLSEAKKQSGADALLCIMSGNFVQRGEAAILEKHVRAKHAVKCGADIVIELPTVFATSNAEIFASGAISLLSTIPTVTHLCFGAELADKGAFLDAANKLLNEPETVSSAVKSLTNDGMSYAQAITLARAKIADERLFSSPNNILGLEYTKAILAQGASIDILPIKRQGSGYNDTDINGEFASATAIRAAIGNNTSHNLSEFLPACTVGDLQHANCINLDAHEKLSILQGSPEVLATTLDCTEGLENAFLKASKEQAPLVETLCSPRYTASRIRRIALHNLLNIRKEFIMECLREPLYLHPLAYKAERKDVLSALAQSSIPFLSAGKEKRLLTETAKRCLETDELAENVYSIVSAKNFDTKTILL